MTKINLNNDTITLYNRDCVELILGSTDITPHSVDLILCDLPYGTTQNGWDSVIPMGTIWQMMKRVLSPTGIIVLTASDTFTAEVLGYERFIENRTKSWLRDRCIWLKSTHGNFINAGMGMGFIRKYEDVIVFSGASWRKMTFNPITTEGKPYKIKRDCSKTQSDNYGKQKGIIDKQNEGTRLPTNVLSFDTRPEDKVHPTSKSVELFEYLVKTFSNEGDIVLDMTMGGGTTGVACVRNNRKFIGIELDTKYFNICVNRVQASIPKGEIILETPKEEIILETPKEEIILETPKEEIILETPKEEIILETPRKATDIEKYNELKSLGYTVKDGEVYRYNVLHEDIKKITLFQGNKKGLRTCQLSSSSRNPKFKYIYISELYNQFDSIN